MWLFEQHPPQQQSDINHDVMKVLKERAEATLSNLATVSKTHTTTVAEAQNQHIKLPF